MATSIVLDPGEVATDRVEFTLTPWIGAVIDYGDAEIQAYQAEVQRGQLPIDYRLPNRMVQIPLILRTVGTTTFDQVRSAVQAKASLFQREGGWLKRSSAIGSVFADVVNATLHFGGSGVMEDVRRADVEATLTLECLPDWYEGEIDLGTTTETVLPELRRVMSGIRGNYPGRCRIVVTDLQGIEQRGVIFGIRSGNYSVAATAATAYEAEALMPQGGAGAFALTGASGGSVMRQAQVPSGAWAPLLTTTILATGADMTHTGSYRAWARCRATDATTRFQLLWNVGSLGGTPEQNSAVTIPGINQFYDLELGEVRLDRTLVGTHRWQGQIQVTASLSGTTAYVDRVWLAPTDDAYGVVRMSNATLPTTVSVNDAFPPVVATVASVINGRIPEIGVAWASSGAAGDFTQNLDTSAVPTQAYGMSRLTAGRRWAVVGGNTTNQAASAVFTYTSPHLGDEHGIVARWVDANNNLRLVFIKTTADTQGVVGPVWPQVIKRVAGVDTVLLQLLAPTRFEVGADYYQLDLSVDTGGVITAKATAAGGSGNVYTASTVDTALATGGTLASGRIGLTHQAIATSTTEGVFYERFTGTLVPPTPIVIHPTRSLQLRHDGHWRQTFDGVGYDRVTRTLGDLPRMPPSGMENRSVELFVKTSRSEFESTPDSGIDDVRVQVFYRPSWAYVPE